MIYENQDTIGDGAENGNSTSKSDPSPSRLEKMAEGLSVVKSNIDGVGY